MRKVVRKVVDWIIALFGFAFVLVFSFMVAGAAADRWAIGEQEQEAEE